MALPDLIPTLQLSVSPVILISGVGLLLLSMTNRFGRIIDRSRSLTKELRASGPTDQPRLRAELQTLARRARLVRSSILLATTSVLLAALLVITLFIGAVFGLDTSSLIVGVFVLCLGTLIGSLLLFLLDINLSLHALWLEMEPERRQESGFDDD